MNSERLLRMSWWVMGAVVMLSVATGWGAGWGESLKVAGEGTGTSASQAAADVQGLEQLPLLAKQGRFDLVLGELQAREAMVEGDEAARSLVSDLERYARRDQEQKARHEKMYVQSMEKMGKAVDDGKLEDAILALIDAHSVATDREKMLRMPEAVTVVERTQAAAEKAREEGDWLEAVSLYRLLDALYEESQQYRGKVRETERHVRLLRLYAPEELRRLFVERAKRLGKENLEPPAFGNETWEQQLNGVEMGTLVQAMQRSAREHVGNGGYRPLLMGALESLDGFAQTGNLGVTFAEMKDVEKVGRFRKGLGELKEKIRGEKSLDALDMRRMLDAVGRLNRETIDLPDPVLAHEMGEGVTANLDDYSMVIWPREGEELKRTMQGKFFGIGILIGQRLDPQLKIQRLVVVSPLANTPARKAGLKPGDAIVGVNGQPTTGWTLDQAVRTITGDENTDVVLTIERAVAGNGGEGEGATTQPERKTQRWTVKITRQEIPIESIKGWERLSAISARQEKAGGEEKASQRDEGEEEAEGVGQKPAGTGAKASDAGWNYWIDPVSRIAYIRLTQFIPQSADDMDEAIEELEKTGPLGGLILDLRYDPGGLLGTAIEVTNRFVRQGLIVSTVGGDGKVRDEFKARAERTYKQVPLVVLVNEGSASASEIASGAIQDHGRGLIVGARSFGKGSVQDLFPLDIKQRSYLKLTTQYYRLPKGRIIHRQPGAGSWGIEPDLVVRMTAGEAADALEARQNLDVLRDAGDPPTTQPVQKAEDLLEQGVDPQLETALVVLKTKVVAERLKEQASMKAVRMGGKEEME